MSTITTDCESWIGSMLVDGDHCRVGKIEAIYFDEQTDSAQWMVVKTGLFGTRHSFVPLAGATAAGDVITTPIDKGEIDRAPMIDAAEDVPDAQVVELYRYYCMPYDEPVGAEPPAAGDTLTERVLRYVG
jgi:hypothetical protein